MSSLPLIIYEFARSPYPEQQTARLDRRADRHLRRPELSIAARALSASRSGEK